MGEMVVGLIIFLLGAVIGYIVRGKIEYMPTNVEPIDVDKPLDKKTIKELKKDDLSEFRGIMTGPPGYQCFDIDKMTMAADEEGEE